MFERRVILVSGEKRTDTFKSHYVPWQAVCLVGKKVEKKVKEEVLEGENPFEDEIMKEQKNEITPIESVQPTPPLFETAPLSQ